MWFLDQIVSWLNSIKEWFFAAYLEVSTWTWPFNNLATPLWYIYTAFIYLKAYFIDFNDWVNDTVIKLTTILSYANISSYFSSIFNAATNAWNWILNATWNIWVEVENWWSSVSLTVQSWIDAAKDMLLLLIGELELAVVALQAAWETFQSWIPSLTEILSWFTDWWGWILARIISWGGLPATLIQALIDSTLLSWFPWYDTLVEIWNEIVAFFANPWDYIEAKFVNWWLGPE